MRAKTRVLTAAIVNVVCELGWRRPHDFLPLAPRLFELLVRQREQLDGYQVN